MTIEATGRLHLFPTAVSARWRGNIRLTALAGLAYFLAAHLSLHLMTLPDGVAVFWPAAVFPQAS